ncbi:HelD family protein [Paenibacillus sp. GCM10012307]|uniref:DNA 3'-5' helicase n=1 Tax=Paenibacillus roseus TaxID=2798579 RepID=A0A934J1D1_9BACL|nr:3'-5' exonuclease [Paenibacillus roseus]MBJ6360975.1 AAA family ATPase [Paenibacillus roseus]
MEMNRAYEEEQARLKETMEEISQQIEGIGDRYYGDNFVEQLLDAKREEDRNRLGLLLAEPYFGRLDFMEEQTDKTLPLYIGKRGMEDSKTGEPYIIDWRAPVASLFYTFTGGEEPVVYEAPEGPVGGEVLLKRNLSVRKQALERVVDSYVRGGDNLSLTDEFLLYRLGEKKDNRLRDIVSTIQAEQDRIIRAPRLTALIIQGAAGSGKTTVALHRLAYLLYQYQDQVRPERMVIFAPNTMFLDYISGVLPELGVGDVRQTTFADWVIDLLDRPKLLEKDMAEGKQWFSVGNARNEQFELSPGRCKGSLVFKDKLDQFIARYEADYLPGQDFEAWSGKVLPAADIAAWFRVEYRHYPLAPRRERLTARMNRWLEMELNQIGDPKIRKERSKTSKQRMRAYVKRLGELDALQLYRQLFDTLAADLGDGVNIPVAVVEQTRRDLKKSIVRQEDLAPLAWLHLAFHGTPAQKLDHVVLDEAQDVPPLQIEVLKVCMNEASFTILGDLAQGIHAYRGIQRWEEFTALFSPDRRSYHELRQSYRSTMEIIEFANTILPFTDTLLPPAQPVFRSGEPVRIRELTEGEDRISYIRNFIAVNEQDGMATIAVIARTEEDSAALCQALLNQGVEASLISEGQRGYSGGISVVPVYLTKGLEFDAVLLLDVDAERYTAAPQDAKLLYVGSTRALHRLELVYQGEASPLTEGGSQLVKASLRENT